METVLFAFGLVILSFMGLGVSVLFFGKKAKQSACGEVPKTHNEDCPSYRAGICPIEDTSGALKQVYKTKLTS